MSKRWHWTIVMILTCLALATQSVGISPVTADDPEEVHPYDGVVAAPCWPESIASLLDDAISQQAKGLSLDLVSHPHPSTQPAERLDTVWIVSRQGRPIHYLLAPDGEKPKDGLTARALQRARMCIAEHYESRKFGESHPKDWRPNDKMLSPAHQAQTYDLQIVRLELVDAKREQWRITAAPLKANTIGGELWMTFDADSQVSVEFGK